MGFRDSGSGIRNVCFECQDRYPACHDTCEKYVEAKAEYEERKAKVKTERDKYKEIDLYHLQAVRRTRQVKCKSKVYNIHNHKK